MKKWKKALSLLLALSMVFSMVLTAGAETKPMPFSDVSGHWAQNYILEANELDLMDGYPDGTFQPDGTLTRAEMVQVLYNEAGAPSVSGQSKFTDGNGQWYTPAIIWAEQNGIINGYPDGSCGANDPVTRQEMVTILHRYADVNVFDEMITVFPDWNQVGDWAQAAFIWAIAEGLVNGVLGDNGIVTLDPQATANRASFAKIMVTFVKGLEEPQPPVESEDPEPPAPPVETETPEIPEETEPVNPLPPADIETDIVLKDLGITVEGHPISTNPESPVYSAHDIVFYLEDQGFTYGEGTEADEHSQEEADWHTVVHITKPGTYRISGKLTAGQIAVDLGKEAKEDPEAVVTLILDNVNITCTVAPAIIFYNVYECDTVWVENEDTALASMEVDTSAAGANVIIPDGTENYVKGSYVARIYKPGSVELNEAGTEVLDAKKLHKYDAAFYSKMSMNVFGGEENTGALYIEAENEGLDSELHLTLNGGMVYIAAGNDCINTNEDYVSVTTVNGGGLIAISTGTTGEGDAVDSNGWLVINGGVVIVQGYSTDGSLDADNGVYVNGGVVLAAGAMQPERGFNGTNPKVLFNYSSRGDVTLTIKDAEGNELISQYFPNGFSYIFFSYPEMTKGGTYTLWNGETQVATGTEGASSGGMGPGGPGGMMPPGGPGGEGGMPTPPEGGEMPQPPQGGEGDMPTPPEGGMPEGGGGDGNGDPASMATITDNGDGTYSVALGGMAMDTYEVNGVSAKGGETITVTAPEGTIYVKCTAQGGPNKGLEYTYTV